ncbi:MULTISPECIES: hypothetical protein [Streptomyces]|uniref:Lipoprotein n=3 Tax=Streptomyces rimosus TaxID=1927 RepID=L8EPZ8_STRR1|nr:MULTISPECIES: hypothetical protein [Streptomyces]KOG84113.1 hypothetical protein ADK78_00455 [Kitasatospora aureofaciens]MYT46408.1 hypothetical protein [Streptomyces sp. SID5471]KEF07553.1 hypothetical protein DF17_08350 [Streptomyces rimosus]KOT27986.1 hypothetical protein ADK84_37640 [Streptomyces sp. NRRL WC-3701]KOT42285.1 hypothetical protein ADK42_10405 [Streptomyces rimosus subsp. rimosus]
MSSSATARTARRRTLRVAAAALIATAGLTLTACSGSDSTGTKAAATSQATTNQAATNQAATSGTDMGMAAAESKAGVTAKKSSPVRTQPLPDGSKAQISKLGEQHYRVKIINRGAVLATLEANGKDTGLDANGMYVVLTLDGQVHAWMGGEHQGPGTFKLAGGWTAKVTKVGELHYRAQIIGHDGVVGTLDANQHDTGGVANGVYIVLSAGGVISSHL